MNRVIEWPVHQMNSDRDFSRSSHGFFWKGLMTMNRSARNFWPMVVALAGMTLCAALASAQAPYRFDAAAVSGLPAVSGLLDDLVGNRRTTAAPQVPSLARRPDVAEAPSAYAGYGALSGHTDRYLYLRSVDRLGPFPPRCTSKRTQNVCFQGSSRSGVEKVGQRGVFPRYAPL